MVNTVHMFQCYTHLYLLINFTDDEQQWLENQYAGRHSTSSNAELIKIWFSGHHKPNSRQWKWQHATACFNEVEAELLIRKFM